MTNLSVADYSAVIGGPARRNESSGDLPLRILHVTPYFAEAWAYGGIPRVASALARGLARRGHAVTVCTTDARDESTRVHSRELRTSEGVIVRVFPNFSNALAYRLQLFVPLGLSTFLRRHAAAFDVAHLHACRNMPGAIAAHHLRKAGVPYVLAPNGTAPLIERRRLAKRGFDLAFGRRVISNAARILAVTEAEQKQLQEMGIDSAVVREIPNPIDLREFERVVPRGNFRRRFSIGSDPLILFLGKLTPRKRVDVLARAFAALPRGRARLVIAGNDMGTEGDLRALVRQLGIDKETLFTGLLREECRLEALADADVVAYPSEHEIFGLVPIEALLCGTPVIVSDDSGCGEIIRRTGGGQVIAVGDAIALAAAIGRVLQAPAEWRARANAAAVRVRELYSDAAVCERLERIYGEVVRR